jgi:hypothetical protein
MLLPLVPGERGMYTGKLVFAQVMEHVPMHSFRRCVQRYRGNHKSKSFTCLDQYLCMAPRGGKIPRIAPQVSEGNTLQKSNRIPHSSVIHDCLTGATNAGDPLRSLTQQIQSEAGEKLWELTPCVAPGLLRGHARPRPARLARCTGNPTTRSAAGEFSSAPGFGLRPRCAMPNASRTPLCCAIGFASRASAIMARSSALSLRPPRAFLNAIGDSQAHPSLARARRGLISTAPLSSPGQSAYPAGPAPARRRETRHTSGFGASQSGDSSQRYRAYAVH